MADDSPLARAEARITAAAQATELDLSFLELGSLPPSVRGVKQLRKLDVSRCALKKLPPWLGELTELRTLNVSYNRELKSLPESLDQLANLTRLDASFCSLGKLPQTPTGFAGLVSLSLMGNKLNALPEWVAGCPALEEVLLYRNKLKVFPESILKLARLAKLQLDENRLAALPSAVSQLTSLASLTLSDNQLKALPEEIGDLPELAELSLRGNKLAALPDSLARLGKLSGLDLSNNRLKRLPSLPERLKSLDFSGNRLKELPSSLPGLTMLQSLRLHGNRLAELPQEVVALPRLTELLASDNPLPEDVLAALNDGLAGLRSHLAGTPVPPFDFQQLRREIHAGAKAAFSELRAKRPKETFYAYALNTDESIVGVSAAANSVAFFEKHAARGKPQNRELYRWMLAEWGYEAVGGEHLPGIERRLTSADLGRDGDPDRRERFQRCVGRAFAAMVLGLRDLDAEGFFGVAEARARVTLYCDVSDSDDSAWLMDESAKALNPSAVYGTFRQALRPFWPEALDQGGATSNVVREAFLQALSQASA